MPKGQKAIEWTDKNDARLILTILAVENLYPNCEAVATAFGGSVNAMAISNRLSRLRKKAAEEGLVPQGGAAATTKGRKSNGASTKAKGAKNGVTVAEGSESGTQPADREGSVSPPTRKAPGKGQKVLTGRITKARGAAKKSAKGLDRISEELDAEVGDDAGEGPGVKNEMYDEEEDAAHVKEEEVY